MAEVTVTADSLDYSIQSNFNTVYATIDIAANGDVYTKHGLKVVRKAFANQSGVTSIAITGSSVAFTTTGALTAVDVMLLGW